MHVESLQLHIYDTYAVKKEYRCVFEATNTYQPTQVRNNCMQLSAATTVSEQPGKYRVIILYHKVAWRGTE